MVWPPPVEVAEVLEGALEEAAGEEVDEEQADTTKNSMTTIIDNPTNIRLTFNCFNVDTPYLFYQIR